MDIELRNSQPVPISELDLIVDGERIGAIKKDTVNKQWHASFKIPGAPFMMNLAQGFGSTPQNAINDAFNATSNEAKQFLLAASIFEKKLSSNLESSTY